MLIRPTRQAHAKRGAPENTEDFDLVINESNNYFRMYGTCWRSYKLHDGTTGNEPIIIIGIRAPERAHHRVEISGLLCYDGAFLQREHDTNDFLAGPLGSKVRPFATDEPPPHHSPVWRGLSGSVARVADGLLRLERRRAHAVAEPVQPLARAGCARAHWLPTVKLGGRERHSPCSCASAPLVLAVAGC